MVAGIVWCDASRELIVIRIDERMTSAIGSVRAWQGDMSALRGIGCVKMGSADLRNHTDDKGS